MTKPTETPRQPRVLCADDDHDIAEVVEAILTDEGYEVSCLYDVSDDTLRRTVGQLEPDVVLLDGAPGADEFASWDTAEWLDLRPRSIPVVMFTAHQRSVLEAQERSSERARKAGFAAIIGKPFELDELLAAVATAAGHSRPFDSSRRAEAARTRALIKALQAAGASDITASTRREWATFRDGKGQLHQVYWWQGRGVYQVGRYEPDGIMRMIGQFTDLQAAIDIALRPSRSA